jgi:hypothetical protein
VEAHPRAVRFGCPVHYTRVLSDVYVVQRLPSSCRRQTSSETSQRSACIPVRILPCRSDRSLRPRRHAGATRRMPGWALAQFGREAHPGHGVVERAVCGRYHEERLAGIPVRILIRLCDRAAPTSAARVSGRRAASMRRRRLHLGRRERGRGGSRCDSAIGWLLSVRSSSLPTGRACGGAAGVSYVDHQRQLAVLLDERLAGEVRRRQLRGGPKCASPSTLCVYPRAIPASAGEGLGNGCGPHLEH